MTTLLTYYRSRMRYWALRARACPAELRADMLRLAVDFRDSAHREARRAA